MDENCKMCGKPLKKFTQVWWERLDGEASVPVVGKYIPRQGVVKQVLRTKGEPGNLRITYWTGQVGYNGRGFFCSVKCGYEWAMDEIEARRKSA